MARTFATLALGVVVAGCAHLPMSAAEVDRLDRPAFLSRIEEGAGPSSTVFRDDASAYAAKLKKLDPKEADRRLASYLRKGNKGVRSISRFEVAELLRAETLSLLPRQRPWTRAIDPAEVARALESFLVEEVPANRPDYDLLKELGADSVVELVIEEYGMRSAGGKAGLFLSGYARAFRIGGGELYHRLFFSDELRAGLPGLDPFEVAKNPQLFSDRLRQMLVSVAQVLAADLNPPERASAPVRPEPQQGSDVVQPKRTPTTPPPSEPEPL